jgi:hypothetical protein
MRERELKRKTKTEVQAVEEETQPGGTSGCVIYSPAA